MLLLFVLISEYNETQWLQKLYKWSDWVTNVNGNMEQTDINIMFPVLFYKKYPDCVECTITKIYSAHFWPVIPASTESVETCCIFWQ